MLARLIFDMLSMGGFFNQALTDVWSTGLRIKCLYCRSMVISSLGHIVGSYGDLLAHGRTFTDDRWDERRSLYTNADYT